MNEMKLNEIIILLIQLVFLTRTHPHVVSTLCDSLSFAQYKRRYFEECWYLNCFGL